MTNQYIWAGIAAGLFLAGIAVGYGIFTSMYQPMPMLNQQMFSQMMDNQMNRQQMMTSMMGDQQFMSGMMSDPQFQSQMIKHMYQNHDFTQSMIANMMDDPAIRGQMIGHMLENREFMQQMQDAMGNQTGSGSMGMMQ